MGRRRGTASMTARVDLRADPDWLAQVEEAGRRLGLGISAYIRLATSERLARDGFTSTPEPPARRQRGRKSK
jgi:hypothetical protein